jgi:N-acetylneuraminate synthase
MLHKTFGYPVGFSDHTIGTSIPLSSIALGACLIEKHFTTDKQLPGWDHLISANPEELMIITKESKNINTALGGFRRIVSQEEEEKKTKFRRSLVTTKKLKAGHILTEVDLTAKRPGTGIPPSEINLVIGKLINVDIEEDSLIKWDNLKNNTK